MTGTTEAKSPSRTRPSRKPSRWLSGLVVLGVVLVSGTVLADVILSYEANGSIGPTIGGPFRFQQGANYAIAHSLGMSTETFAGGGLTNGPMITTVVSGVIDVPTSLLDVAEFATAIAILNPSAIGNVNVPTPTAIGVPGLVCAYAFVSTAAPSTGAVPVVGQPAGCFANTPALGAVAPGCAAGIAAVATVNLLTGAITGTIAGDCTVNPGTAAGVVVLYISYAFTANAAIAGTTVLNSLSVPVTVT